MKHVARKRFGQNFLTDLNIIDQIIGHLQIQPKDHWLEIGPGLGALTEPLLNHDIRLDVVELDRDLAAELTRRFGGREGFRLHQADALTVDFKALTKDGKLRMVGNLPYNISTPLLFHLLAHSGCFQDLSVMLQQEVVKRICAAPGGKDYGRLTVMLQYHCQPEPLFQVPPESFQPAPKVMSAMVRLVPHAAPPVAVTSHADFQTLVTQAFSQRRKTLRNTLRTLLPQEVWADLAIDPSARAETLTLSQFAALANVYTEVKTALS
ncbi:MAG: 16S rRNA (adenine(1518)-N(6)/adenine(1519)-N(6))-dimethyltransferase RsmA [Methylococcales bacterium]|nr:16S rRNA (adenine(1518)-N(6)/adenine(1519)-N(6))-dimethyltransferase RsmA [Methylococcales bacterium]